MKPRISVSKQLLSRTSGIIFLLAFLPVFCFCQTMTKSGNWDDAGNWSGGNIGDLISEDVSISSNKNATIQNGFSYTVGNVTLNSNNDLTINSGGSLTLGSSTDFKNLITNSNTNIVVAGTLIIWGDVQINANLDWDITGTVIIKGNVTVGSNADVGVSGNLVIDGDFNAGSNANVDVSGSVTVGGDVNVGANGDLDGCTDCFQVGGSCTGPTSFCNSTVLPIELFYFRATVVGETVKLDWATTAEENFDKFIVQRSVSGIDFEDISEVKGAGYNVMSTKNEYSLEDPYPLSGLTYYRLKSVDLDSQYDYSKIISVRINEEKKFDVYPNPVNGEIHYFTNFHPAEADRVLLINQLGEPLLNVPASYNAVIEMNAGISPGIYLLKYLSPGSSQLVVRVEIR